MRAIPFTEVSITDAERLEVQEALNAGALTGDGEYCKRAERQVAGLTGARHVLLTTSCTHALEMAMMIADLGPGDEVILPSFTFTSTANAVVRQGATPVFADIDPDTFNLSAEAVSAAVTAKTRCVIPVHYAGQACDMDAIGTIAQEHELLVVEDAAQALGATWNGRQLGTVGDIGCVSFHATKNIVCGEGGAFLTNNSEIAQRAEILREKGTNRSAFLRGQVDKYTWVSLGSSYVLSDLLAAVLDAQLRRFDDITARRLAIWNTYYDRTAELEAEGFVKRPVFLPGSSNVGHIFALLVQHGRRESVMEELRRRRITVTFHYVPLHTSPYMQQLLGPHVPVLPVTDRVSRQLMRLPLFPHMTSNEVDYVVDNVIDVIRAI